MAIQASGGATLKRASATFSGRTDFGFLPKGLLEECSRCIKGYHQTNGYSCLPDFLWHPEIRNLVETEVAFQRLFKKSTSSRSAKRANAGLVCIATAILAMEVLSTGFAGWATLYPGARKKAQAILQESIPSGRAWLMKWYLNPRLGTGPKSLEALERFFKVPSRDMAPSPPVGRGVC
jgi:hypothetical protein